MHLGHGKHTAMRLHQGIGNFSGRATRLKLQEAHHAHQDVVEIVPNRPASRLASANRSASRPGWVVTSFGG